MFVTRMLWGMCLCALASSAASAAGETFVAEGLVDPALLAARTGGKSAAEVEEFLLAQATLNEALHLGAYARGVQFQQQPGPEGSYVFATAGAEFQRLGGLSPETRKLRMLKSGLGLAEVTYGTAGDALLNLPKDYFSLPIYRVKGEYLNPGDATMSKIGMHWKAVNEAFHAALVEHLAKAYPGKELVLVRGRAFPVRVIEAELVPVAASAVPSGAAAPKRVSLAESASAATTATAATSTAAAEPASSAVKAAGPAAFDSKQYIYRVEVDVRIRLDEVKFAEEKPATSAAPAVSASPATSTSSAAGAVAPSSAASATSATPAAAQ